MDVDRDGRAAIPPYAKATGDKTGRHNATRRSDPPDYLTLFTERSHFPAALSTIDPSPRRIGDIARPGTVMSCSRERSAEI